MRHSAPLILNQFYINNLKICYLQITFRQQQHNCSLPRQNIGKMTFPFREDGEKAIDFQNLNPIVCAMALFGPVS
jgi:hypothetical protein